MTDIFKKYKPVLLKAVAYSALTCSFAIGDQIRRFFRKINEATSTDVLAVDRIQPTYIYIEDPFVQEEIAADLSEGREHLKLPKFHKWLFNKIEESFVFRNLFSFKKNLAWRYLQLAQDENRNYRFRAIQSLASLMNLNDADYQQLAQACDMKTAVGLARTADHVKFLLDPPYFKIKQDRKALIEDINDFFLTLDPKGNHPCLQVFIAKVVLGAAEYESKGIDDDLRMKFDKSDFLPSFLEALLHHSSTDESAKEIVKQRGLAILMEIYKDLKDSDPENVDSVIVLSKLLSNLSACSDSQINNHFFVTGWIKILSILAQHKDPRISAPAQKALANLDEDDFQKMGGSKYLRNIYPLYPTRRTVSQPKVDVVFIHGLLGEIFVTWRQREAGHCSPKSPLELLVAFRKVFEYELNNLFNFQLHLSGPKKVPSFPIPEPGITSEDDRDRIFEETKLVDQDFFVDVAEMNSWEKVSSSYEFVLADIPIDSNSTNTPLYGSSKEIDCNMTETFTKCWPKDWLPQDCPEIHLLGINYETNLSKWTHLCPLSPTSVSIIDRSRLMVTTLSQAGVGKRPIVWVGHSMGGLIIKGILSLAHRSSDPNIRSLYEQTRGIVFYSTPHKGSHLAAFTPASQIIVWPSVEVQELRENSPVLLQLHETFLELIKKIPVKVISFAERESTYITALKFEIRFVDDCSADPDVGEVYGIPLDHLSICKPSGRQSFLYQKVKKLIREIISETS